MTTLEDEKKEARSVTSAVAEEFGVTVSEIRRAEVIRSARSEAIRRVARALGIHAAVRAFNISRQAVYALLKKV